MKNSVLVILGMATQAFVTGLLSQLNIIHPEPMQQFLAAIILLIVARLSMELP